MWGKRISHPLLVGMQSGTATLGDSMAFLTKLNMLLTNDPAIAPVAIYPNELKINVHTKTCSQARWVSSRDLMFNTVPIVNNNIHLNICQEGLCHVRSSYHNKIKERKWPILKTKPFTWTYSSVIHNCQNLEDVLE